MIDIPTRWEPRTNKHPTGVFVAPPAAWPCCSSPVPPTTKKVPRPFWSGDSWWSIVHSTRTQNLFTGDGFGIIREVEIEHYPVVKDVDRVDKGINDLPLVFCTAHVTLAEFFKPEPHPFAGQDGLFQLFFQNAGIQSFFPGFQFVQPLLGGRGQDALFNGFQKICQPLLCIPELVFQDRQPGVLLLLGFHN